MPNVAQLQDGAHRIKYQIEPLLRPGDLIFRLGETRVAGSYNFSKMIAEVSDSDFSHVVLVYDVINGEALISDIELTGMRRSFLVDWLMEGQTNIVVKRLKREYQSYIPSILQSMSELVRKDPLYDIGFGQIEDDNKYYCIEAVDHCFRESGLPLADRIPFRELPGFDKKFILLNIAGLLIDFDLSTPISIAGNNEIGLFSSPYLEIVIDLR